MQTNRRLYYTKFEKTAEFNQRKVLLLDGKCYYPLERILRKLDVVSFVRFSRTCKGLNEKIKSVRGLQYPFDMGVISLSFYSMSIWKHGVQTWNIDLASKTHKQNPNFAPYISKIHVSPVFVKGMYEKLIPVLCDMGIRSVKEICIRDVEQNAWEELKEFIMIYRILKVTFFCKIPFHQQLSSNFLMMNNLEHKGIWSVAYIMQTMRVCFNLPSNFLVNQSLMSIILRRWHNETFNLWKLFTSDMNFVAKCLNRYHTVLKDQKNDFPEQRPLLCHVEQRDNYQSLAFLNENGRAISVKCFKLSGRMNIWLEPYKKHNYPVVFKRILGIYGY